MTEDITPRLVEITLEEVSALEVAEPNKEELLLEVVIVAEGRSRR